MSEIISAIVLGIVQGLTEFLPVSSSGHLELAKYILGDTSMAQQSLLMTVTLHVATALSTIVVFRKDIAEVFRGLFAFKWNQETEFSLKIIISMIPAAIVGLLFEKQIEALFTRNILLVAGMLAVTGVLLMLAHGAKDTGKSVSNLSALLIGIAQAIAITPGISRSGATISTSVLLGIDRGEAARFSFLMVVPLILGKLAKDLLDGEYGHTENMVALASGFVFAFLTGLFACRLMIRLVKGSKLIYFSIYCFAVAIIAAAYILSKG
jgi:undecaprenyl-diphosphatase